MAGELRDFGKVRPGELERVVVLSPHLDDAVLGAAHLMATYPRATVVTVFAGGPAEYPDPMTWWDGLSGFGPGDDPLLARRAEDVSALGEVDADPVHLDFVEHQYFEGDRDESQFVPIVDAVERAVRDARATSVFAPFGIANPDHAYVNDVALAVRARVGDDIGWFCYEDTGYKLVPGLLAWRISKLFLEALWPTPVAVATTRDEPRKERAMRCYASQIKSLGADWDLENAMLSPEQYWRLAPPPAGWEVIIDDIR